MSKRKGEEQSVFGPFVEIVETVATSALASRHIPGVSSATLTLGPWDYFRLAVIRQVGKSSQHSSTLRDLNSSSTAPAALL